MNKKLKLRKMKYTEDCIRNGEMNNPGNDDERIHAITSLQESLHQLEETSPLEEVRDRLATTLRKYLSSLNWQHLHCLCVPSPTFPYLQALDGFIPFSTDPANSCDIHTLMSQISVQFPAIQFACFLFNNFFVVVICRRDV